jgi:branched-chain amino acid transport system substrate-binding protein
MSLEQRRSTRKKRLVAVVASIAAASLLAACSSSKSNGGGSTPTTGGSGAATSSGGGSAAPSTGNPDKKTLKIGVVGSFTGSAASGFTGLKPGVEARFKAAEAANELDGRTVQFVYGDDQSTPQGAQSAVSKLTTQDHVDVIVEVSSVFYGGYKQAVKSGIPVFGTTFDACTCWQDKANTNLFAVGGSGDYHAVTTTYGELAKKLNITKLGGLSYTTSESSTLSVKGWIESAKKAGLQAGFSQGVAFGSTDVGPVVLGIKNSGTDGFYMSTIPNTAFAVAGGLQQQGLKLKGTFLATGYGGDLLASDAAVQAAQGLQFLTATSPVELKTPGTLKMQDGLNKYANQSMDIPPGFSMTEAWLAADAAVWAIHNAGDDSSPKNIINTNRAGTWDSAGLEKPITFDQYEKLAGGGVGPGNCTNVVTLQGKKFVPIEGLNPICGTIIDGDTVNT